MKLSEICIEFEPDTEMVLKVNNVPKSVMKQLAKKIGIPPEFEGVTESLKAEVCGVTVKLCRITNREDVISMEG